MSDTNQNPQPIIDLILADINAVIPNLSSLVASYRLLVGASEEIHRTPEICPDVFERAVRRADNAGSLIDIFIELLYCKIAFSSEFLKISCAPVDLFRLLANRNTATDVPFHTAEQVVEMEVLRRILERCQKQNSCLPEHPVVCPKPSIPPPPISPPLSPSSSLSSPPCCNSCCHSCCHPGSSPCPVSPPPPSSVQQDHSSDVQEVESAILLTKLKSQLSSNRELPTEHTPVCPEISQSPIESRVRRKHLKDAYDTPTKPKKR